MHKRTKLFKNSKLEFYLRNIMTLLIIPYLIFRVYQVNPFLMIGLLIGWIHILRLFIKNKNR